MSQPLEGLKHLGSLALKRIETITHPQPYGFPGIEHDVFIGDDGYFKREKRHKEHNPHCVRDLNTLTTSEESIAIQRLNTCKGIFLIFPDHTKGAIHLWPTPKSIDELQANIKKNYSNISLQGAIPIIISSNKKFLSDDFKYSLDVSGASHFEPDDLGLKVFYDVLRQTFSDLNIDTNLFFANEFIRNCTIELTDSGLRIFDYSRIIDKNGKIWFAPEGWSTGKCNLRPIKEVLDEVNKGLLLLNKKLKNRGLLN